MQNENFLKDIYSERNEKTLLVKEIENLKTILKKINKENNNLNNELELIKINSEENCSNLQKINILSKEIERANIENETLKNQIIKVLFLNN